ncbi:MAG: Co2+/Mg2+ efflux protein ApaG [Betaproteobacteria bacterium]|jgi:ApaG protein|uniref:Co2+/Mg2+ efflux protein ApaG n=1 Tax=Serpentinimonas maccroryi TaxID=1458426 RepID=UPI0020335021|nr:Co2+/Mg2+ efflux protein ApaG [Serpentinimonas maccroryi]MBA4252594.1 Co2+/Mg2+ efflux protein ApaG [Comamonadaceae bacterium]MCL5969231.1 Co2+/Mg2+ efflux protein ApaG [Betaproteobacteria bacterium]MCM2480133.1 Co2+/Mg2+ efflux protein ApaG [Serpentinimonas maccroryi]
MPRYQFTCEVEPEYVPEQSDPAAPLYLFAYTVTIRNSGEVAAQLVARHWEIEDARGQTQTVDGLGVVGQQPLLQPGAAFRYSSSVPLRTPMGLMSGHFFCVAVDGQRFEVPVAAFVLRAEGVAGSSSLH